MLSLEHMRTVRGYQVARDFTDEKLYYYFPAERVRVTGRGTGLELVVYTDDIENDPDFSQSEDHAGAFLTLETETGPDESELAALRSALAAEVGGGITLVGVPFVSGTATLYVLGSGGGTSDDTPGFEVSVAGSTVPALYGSNLAAFSVRLGGKAANVLYETVRRSGDAQAVVCYTLEFHALRAAYNLEVVIDFKETFDYCRKRVGVNALVAKVDLDLLTQELVNKGSITVKEVDYTGDTSRSSPLAAESGVLKLVQQLMSSTLFQPVPVPSPTYRALPDSASQALGTPAGLSSALVMGDGAATPHAPVTAGSDPQLTHTPPSTAASGAAVPLTVSVRATTATVTRVDVRYRTRGTGEAFRDLPMTMGAGTAPPPPVGGSTPPPPSGGTTPPPPAGGTTSPPPPAGGTTTPPPPAGGTTTPPPPAGGTTPPPPAGGTTPPPPAGGTTPPPPAGGTTAPPASTAGTRTWTASIPAQPNGTVVEYYVTAQGTKAGAAITQTLPADRPETTPLSVTAGVPSASRATGVKVPDTDGPLIGFSLTTMEATQQVTRTFRFTRTEAERRQIHPSGVLSRDGLGPDFDPATQVTRVALGQGPFRVIVIRAIAGFEFGTSGVLAATVHVEYGRNPAGDGPMHALDIPLSKDQPDGQTQFFADEAGTQDYSYRVTFTYDPDRVVGATHQELSSPVYSGRRDRTITVDLARHSPLIPVEIVPGKLRFEDKLIEQVQVRVAPSKAAQGRTVVLDGTATAGAPAERVHVLPEDRADPGYHLRQQTFFPDDSTVVERDGVTDTSVVVNEPTDAVYTVTPQLADNSGLVTQVLLDAEYVHADGEAETATLHLTPDAAASPFSVVLRPGDRRVWRATPRFVMRAGSPLSGSRRSYEIDEPLIDLSAAGLRVVSVEMFGDDSVFTPDGLLAIKIVMGADLDDPQRPTSTVVLRAGQTTGAVVVPGVRPADLAAGIAGDPVQVLRESLRRGEPPARERAVLTPSEPTLYVAP